MGMGGTVTHRNFKLRNYGFNNCYPSRNSKRWFPAIAICSMLLILLVPIQDTYALAPGWLVGQFSTNDGGVQNGAFPSIPVQLLHFDAPFQGSITVTVTSNSAPSGVELTLIESAPGLYSNTNFALMTGDNVFSTSDSVIVSILDDSAGGAPILPGPVFIFSDSDFVGITPTFTLTSTPNIYSATINFDTVTNPATNTIAAIPGDIISVVDLVSGQFAHAFIDPNPNLGKGALFVSPGDTVTAQRAGDPITSSFLVVSPPPGGRGGGGVVSPTLVVDAPPSGPSDSSGGGSGCDGDCSHPTLGVDENFNRIVSDGFSFNGNPVDVKSFYTPYPLIKVNVGEENKVVLKVFENGGPQNIEHVGLGFGLGKNEFFSDSRATINLDRTHDGKEIVSTFDPENVLENVRVITSEDKCDRLSPTQCLIVTIFLTFREPLEFNMVATYVWDFRLNSWQNFYNAGIKIEGDSLNPPKTMMVAFGTKEIRGLFELTQIDKIKDTWIDEFGNIYQHKGNSYFNKIYDAPDEVVYDKVTNHGCDRTCNWFDAYKLNQVLEAEITLDNMLQGKSI